MKVVLLFGLLLAGCAASSPPIPDVPRSCPAPVPVPADLIGKPDMRKIMALEIRVEQAREAERKRADLCAAEVEKLRSAIIKHR